MPYPQPDQLSFPLERYDRGDYHVFKKRLPYKKVLWITHLGDDLVAEPETLVKSIGQGEVVFAELRPGTPRRNSWGGLVVIGHTDKNSKQPFYSVYGHMYKLTVQVGALVSAGQAIGAIAPANTPENGGWKRAHLHFAIYTGPWHGQILPGYKRLTELFRTRLSWWQDPATFIERYSNRYG